LTYLLHRVEDFLNKANLRKEQKKEEALLFDVEQVRPRRKKEPRHKGLLDALEEPKAGVKNFCGRNIELPFFVSDSQYLIGIST